MPQVALCPSAKSVIVASSHPGQIGFVRSYRLPMTGDYVDTAGHSGPVTCMAVSVDETVVVTASTDGSISFYLVRACARGPLWGVGSR